MPHQDHRARPANRPRRQAVLLLLALLLLALAPALHTEAQYVPRALHWPRIDVTAHLDADGRLHVVERQSILYSGDWNGGERRFDLGPGQDLSDLSLRRLVQDPGGGPARVVEMEKVYRTPGEIDQWTLVNGSTARWRSRLTTDPPFRDTLRVYELDYTLSGVVRSTSGGDYRLNHQFGFGDRDGSIGTLAVRLTLDPAWRAVDGEGTPSTAGADGPGLAWSWRDLPPARSPRVTLELEHLPDGRPAAALHPLPAGLRMVPYLAALAVMLLMVLGFVGRARRSARFRTLPDIAVSPHALPASRAWLATHVFSRPPEEVGALWDRGVGSPEVTAVLARLVQEGKLSSRMNTPSDDLADDPSGTPILHLELLVPPAELAAMERDLLQGLLLHQQGDTTSTAEVKEHYEKKGFQPASLIAPYLQNAVPEVRPARSLHPTWRRLVTPVLFTLACLTWLVALVIDPEVAAMGSVAVWASGLAFVISIIAARFWRRSVHRKMWIAGFLLLPPILALLAVALFMGFVFPGLGMANAGLALLPALVATALLPVAALSSALYQGRLAETAETVAARRRLAHAREHFEFQLKLPDPDLEDAWLPYLLAFGLGKDVEKWSVTPERHHWRDPALSSSMPASSGGGGGGGFSGWSGGGGSFGGAGASSGWSTAVSGLAAGVAAPSSGGGGGGFSGGGGGGGGGSSSGGGGGGGW